MFLQESNRTTALKTLTMRLRGAKTELEDAGLDTENMASSTSKLREQLLALTGVDIMQDENTFKSTTQILREMSAVWEDLSDIDAAAALELMGGKRQANILASALKNWQTVEDAISTSLGSEGSALAENEKYLDSIQGRIDIFNNAVQTMWSNLISSDFVKGVVDVGTKLVQFLDTAHGKILAIIAAFEIFSKFKHIQTPFSKIFDFLSINKESFSALKDAINDVIKVHGYLDASIQKDIASILKQSITINLANSSLVQYAIASGKVTAAQVANMTTTELLGTAFIGLAAKIGAAVKAMWLFLTTTPAGWAILAVGAIAGLVAVVNLLTTSLEEHAEKLNKAKEKYTDITNTLNDLNEELKTTQSRINELEKIDSLSFAEEEELDTLRKTNDELERKIYLEQLLQKEANKEKNKEFVDTMDSSVNSTVSGPGVSSGPTKGVYANTLLNMYSTAKEEYNTAMDEYTKAIEDGDKKAAKKAKKRMNKAEKDMNTYSDQIRTYYDEWAGYASDIEYIPNPTTEDEKAVNNWLDFYNNFADKMAIAFDTTGRASVQAFKRVSNKDEFKDETKALTELSKQGNLTGDSLRNMLSFDKDGKLTIADGDINDFINSLIECGFISGTTEEDLQRVADAFNKVGDFASTSAASIDSIKNYDILSETIEKYNTVLLDTEEIFTNGIATSEDYYNSLKELGISEAELGECIDTNNGYIVTNVDLLKEKINSVKKEIASETKLAKTQAQLQYYDLYKEIKNLTNGTKVTDAATLSYINSLYEQMNSIEGVIAKYSMLEAKLLGVTSAYNKLADAQTADEEMDYASKAEDLINILGDAFNTGELGTEAAKVAFEGLIPDELIDKTKTLDEQMSQAYEYFSNGPLTQLFTIEYDDDGAISSIEMTQENIEGFVDYLLSTDKDLGNGVIGKVFEGSWDEFNLNPAITNIEDFAHAIGTTEEVAFAFLTSLEKNDISWLGGDFSTLLDQLMGEDLEYQLYDKMQKLSDLEMKIANGTITSDEQKTYGTLVNDMDALEKQALSNAIAWSEANSALEDTKSKMIDLNEQLADTEEGSDAYKEIQNELEDCQEEANKLIKDMEEVGEPTEFTLEVAADEAQEQIDEFKSNLDELVKNNDKNAIEIQAVVDEIDEYGIEELGLTKNSDGTWSGLANIKGYSSLDETSKAKVVEYLDLIDSQHIIDALMGDGITTVEQHLQNIVDILQKTYELQVEANVDKDEVTSFIDWLKNTPISKTISFYASKVGSWLGLGGDNEVNGTAHAYGTAHASGNWGLPKSEHNALVGELGQELVVDPHSGKYYTVGDNGAEMVDLPKNAIVFNHKQTKDLLSHGYAVGRGKAYANGTSYSGNNLLDRIERITKSNKLDQLAKYAEEMCEQYEKLVNGNVDLRKRPHLSPSYEHELAMGGGYNSFIGSDGKIYASTSAETWTIGAGENQYTIDITPVLENGEALTSDSLAEYVNNLVTDGSMQDLLNSDKYNLIIRVVPGEYNEEDWAGFEDELSKYKDGYLDTILDMFNIGGEKALEAYGFSPVGLADVSRDLQDHGSYTGKEVASAIDDTSEGMRNLNELINQYVTDVLNAKSLADEIGTDLSKAQYGNVNTDTRQKLYWDEESIDKYSNALDSWGMNADSLIGSYSTLLSMYGDFDGVDIAFTPMLQTEDGPQLLDSKTVNEYIWGLIDKASKDDGQWTSEELFQLDTKGLEFNGAVIKNLLEDIGESASTTSKLLHYVGDTGSISTLEGEIDTTASGLVTAGEDISNVQAKLDLLNDTNISDKTFTVTAVYQTVGSGRSEGVRTPGSGGRYTKYANGTAHINGNAYSNGYFGAPRTEKALTGELGPEMIVRGNKWFTVGDNGAEFTDIKKGDIIFNHKQTESLLKYGYVTGRGKAYAKGTAYSGINTWKDHVGSKNKSNGGSGGGNNDKKDEEEKETFDFIEIKMEEIENLIEKITAKIALFLDDTSDINKKDNYYDKLVEAEKNKASTYLSAAEVYNNKAAELLKEVPEKYRDMAKNGAIAIEDFVGEDEQKTLDAINNYREWAQKADEAEVGYLEAVAQAAAYRVEQLDDIATDFENLTNQIETQAGLVQSHIDLIEESGNIVSEKFYKDLMKKTKEQRSELVREKQSLQKILDDAVKSGDVTVGTDEWFEMVQAIYDVDDAIVQCDIDLEGYQNSINELSWESFERLVDQLDNIDSELSFISDLMSKNDWEVVDEDANWTNKGITALGMYAQQMEIAQTKSQQYAKEIKELKKLRDKGLVSETEYIEKLAELKDGQMDAINAYEDAKDAIVDLNKVRIQTVKDGLEKELDAYQELIEKKKEALDADKDLYDFEKNVAEQQKEIATIQRKIAALSGDNSLSATAQRRKLEAELLEAQADLEDTYRDRSYDNTIDALDKESEAYEESINTQIEELDKSLEDIDAIVAESLATVRANTDTVLAELVDLSKTYGIELSKEITSPWADGEAAISAYSESFKNLKDSFAEELNYLIEQEKILQKEADKAAKSVLDSLGKNEDKVEGATNPKKESKENQKPTQQQEQKTSSNAGMVSSISGYIQYGQQGSNVKKLQKALNELGFNCGSVDGIFGDKTFAAVKKFQSSSNYGGAISADGIVGPDTKKKFKTAGYAKGTLGTKKDELALIDELGEELVMHAGPDGKLMFLSKGSSVIPSNITENLMKIGQLDPTEVLKRSTPSIGAPHITNNNIEVNMQIAEVVHIDEVTNETIPNLTKAVEKQMDKYMKELNGQIRKYAR